METDAGSSDCYDDSSWILASGLSVNLKKAHFSDYLC